MIENGKPERKIKKDRENPNEICQKVLVGYTPILHPQRDCVPTLYVLFY